VNEAVDVLTGNKAVHIETESEALSLGKLPPEKIAAPKIPNLTLPHKIIQSAHGLLVGRERVWSVDVVKIAVLSLFRLFSQDAITCFRAVLVRFFAGREIAFGCDHDVFTVQPGQEVPDDLLRHASGIDVGTIDEVSASVQVILDDGVCFFFITPPIRGSKGHGAERDPYFIFASLPKISWQRLFDRFDDVIRRETILFDQIE
jgi:hypothetical protein